MTPREFWRTSPAETKAMIAARSLQLEQMQELSALHASWVMNMWRDSSSPIVTPDLLLGKAKSYDLIADPLAAEKALAAMKEF